MRVSIPINNEVGVLIGDIYVNVDVKFLPMCRPQNDVVTNIALSRMNVIMSQFSFSIEQDIKAKLQKEFEGNEQ